MINYYDVFVIGAGLAGLNTVRRLQDLPDLTVGFAETGIRSEKNNPARLTFTDTLEKFGLGHCAINTYNAFGIFSYHGAKSVHHFDGPKFSALDYNKACNVLLDSILLNHKVTLHKERVTDMKIAKDFARLKLRSGKEIKAKLVVDASGKDHFSLKKLNLDKPKLYSHSYGRTFENCQIEQTDVAYFIGSSVNYGSGGGWYYPIDGSRASVGFALITDNASFPARELREKFYRALKEVEPIKTYLRTATPAAFETGTIPIQPVEQPYQDRLLVVGDSAGQATSWMCMGVEPALENSQLAVQTIVEAFRQSNFSGHVLKSYKQAWDAGNKKVFDHIEKQKTKIWFLGEDVWDFILEKDLQNLTPQQLYERVKYNAHLMPLPVALWRWFLFKLKHRREWRKYRQHPVPH